MGGCFMKNTRNLTLSGLFLALGITLPFLTANLPQMGSAFLPMHLPVLLCGFVCGWPWGLAVGLITPLLRSVLVGMPPLWPTAFAMAFELATYGALTGVLYRRLPKSWPFLYVSLIGAMLGGRIVWGLVMALIAGANFGFQAFVAGAFVNAIPGIVIQIVLVPALIVALERAKLIPEAIKA
jgi:predicted membrane protein